MAWLAISPRERRLGLPAVRASLEDVNRRAWWTSPPWWAIQNNTKGCMSPPCGRGVLWFGEGPTVCGKRLAAAAAPANI